MSTASLSTALSSPAVAAPSGAAPLHRSYLKSVDFPIHLMALWWLFWIGVSVSPLNDFLAPSWASVAQYVLLIVSFFAGHAAMKWFRPFDARPAATPMRGLRSGTSRMRCALALSTLGCLAMLLVCLRMSGAFETSFVEYFLRVRLAFAEGGNPTLTGIRSLDVLTKILFFPLSYTVLLMLLAIDLTAFKRLFLVCIVNVLCFAYLWQVNYPFIHLFWFMVFYTLVSAQRHGHFNKKILAVASLLFVGLMASAANRFGGDVLGGFQRYIVDYHLIGFSYYDHQYLDPRSILHSPSYGRSSLGFLDQVLEEFLKPLSLGYQSASLETQGFNETPVDIGAHESMTFNAFGTILFSLYRDFDLPGVFLGGFAYGAAATFARYRSAHSWRAGALFMMLAAAWMIGMMVSPLEEVYFWFTIVALGLFGIVNRGVRW
jgi:oligosaccharide repeat unit polymerase